MVEILNENDNFPEFAEDTVHSLDLSEVSQLAQIQMSACLRKRHGIKVLNIFFLIFR